jgi:hypothetical protein
MIGVVPILKKPDITSVRNPEEAFIRDEVMGNY